MLSTLWDELTGFLSSLEQTLNEMLQLLTEKRKALDDFRPDELSRVATREGEVAARMGALVAQRQELLGKAHRTGLTVETLKELAGAIGKHSGDARLAAAVAEVNKRIARAQERTAQLRHESWIHWIISHRNCQHYSELLELIAHGGRLAPTYGDNAMGNGGALLDAAV